MDIEETIGKRGRLEYKCRPMRHDDEVEQGVILADSLGNRDEWGKSEFREVLSGTSYYLFDDEIVSFEIECDTPENTTYRVAGAILVPYLVTVTVPTSMPTDGDEFKNAVKARLEHECRLGDDQDIQIEEIDMPEGE